MAQRKDFQTASPVPDKIAHLIHGYRASQALLTACDLGIFDTLHKSPLSAIDISKILTSNLDATSRLLDALVGLEMLEKTGQGDVWLYNNTTMATKFLTSFGPNSLVDYISLNHKIEYPMFANLTTAVREGKTQWIKTFGKTSEELWKELYGTEKSSLRFIGAMHSSSFHGCYAVAEALDLSEFTSCCDLGGKSTLEKFGRCMEWMCF